MRKYFVFLSFLTCSLFFANVLQAQSSVHSGYLKNFWSEGYLFGGQDFGCMVNESAGAIADANAWAFEPVANLNSTFRLKHIATGMYLHIENGTLDFSKIENGWNSAMWVFEPVNGLANTFRIKNLWKPTLYLNNEKVSKTNGVECTESKPSFNSSYWVIEPDRK